MKKRLINYLQFTFISLFLALSCHVSIASSTNTTNGSGANYQQYSNDNITSSPDFANYISVCLPTDTLNNMLITETNAMASTACQLVKMFQSALGQVIVIIMIMQLGIKAYLAKLSVGYVVTFIIGVVLFFGSMSIIGFLMPYLMIASGCQCLQYFILGENNIGGYYYTDTGLNPDCTPSGLSSCTTTSSTTNSSASIPVY